MAINVGDVVTTNHGKVTVSEKLGNCKFRVIFEDGFSKIVGNGAIRKKSIRNPYYRTVCGLGYLGEGCFNSKDRAYSLWRGMLHRCYDEKCLKLNPQYIGCTVAEDWHNFQNFATWYNEQPNAHLESFEIDKDLKSFGNKVYCKDMCSLIPNRINSLIKPNVKGYTWKKSHNGFAVTCRDEKGVPQFLGSFKTEKEAYLVYKAYKESIVKLLAEEYNNFLDRQVYDNLINFTLGEINYE